MAFSFFYELSRSNVSKFLDDANIARREAAQVEFSVMQTREKNGKYSTRILIGKKWTQDKFALDSKNANYCEFGYDEERDLFCVQIKSHGYGYRVRSTNYSFSFKFCSKNELTFIEIGESYRKIFNVDTDSIKYITDKMILFKIKRDDAIAITERPERAQIKKKEDKIPELVKKIKERAESAEKAKFKKTSNSAVSSIKTTSYSSYMCD